MSFMLTTEQVRNETKTVTRRLGWWFLKAGDIVWACEKCMGLKKSEKVNRLKKLRIISTYAEPLFMVDKKECVKEGFPEMETEEFLNMFIKHMKCSDKTLINRIEFEYV